MTQTGSLAFRVSLYLAIHPGKVISSEWIADNFHHRGQKVSQTLKPAVDAGYLSCVRYQGGFNRYAIGPKSEQYLKDMV